MKFLPHAPRILFIRTDRLGESVLNLPVAAALKAAYPTSHIAWLAHPVMRPLLERLPMIDEVWVDDAPADEPWWRHAAQLHRRMRAGAFDIAIVSNPKKSFHLAVWLAGIPVRIGYDRKWGGLLTHRIPRRTQDGQRHEVECNLDLLGPLGVPAMPSIEVFPSFEREHVEVRALMAAQGADSSKPFVVVHPWTSNPAKQWPVERFRTLCSLIQNELGLPVVLVGGDEERARAHEIMTPEMPLVNPALSGKGGVNLVGRLSLVQLVALLRCGQMLISNDSGPVHVAAMARVRTIVVFGAGQAATGPGRWGPWGAGHTVIARPRMDAITVDDVMGAMRRQGQPTCPPAS